MPACDLADSLTLKNRCGQLGDPSLPFAEKEKEPGVAELFFCFGFFCVVRLREQIVDGDAFIGNLERPFAGRHDDQVVWQTEGFGDGSVEILYGNGVLFDLVARGVGFAVFVTAFDAATRKEAGVSAGMVIATVFVLSFDLGRASEFCGDDHEGVLEFSAFIEIGDQSGVGLVKFFATTFDSGEVVVVGVPSTKLHFDETNAVFDESACQQATLGKTAGAVEFFGFGRLFVEIEGLEVLRIHQFDRFLIKVLVGLHIGIGVATVELLVQFVGKRQATIEVFLGNIIDAFGVLQAFLWTADRSRGKFGTKEAAT